MSSPYTFARLVALGRMVFGILGMALGFAIAQQKDAGFMTIVGFFVALTSTRWAFQGFKQLLGVAVAEQNWRRMGGARTGPGSRASNLPRQIFLLLFSVAESDGTAGPNERQLVREFVLERFRDPAVARDLLGWKAEALRGEQLAGLVHQLRARLSRSECETVFFWCCAVTLIDEKFNQQEQETLQTVSKAFDIPGEYARVVFQNAKARILAGRAFREAQQRAFRGGFQGGFHGGGAHGGGSYGGGGQSYSTGSQGLDQRRAYEVLGLDNGASLDQVRARHRELVKKHHPDRHRHLGKVAQEEASERFREVQQAYEFLTKGA
ncbi:MAG: DnaJ domain-containing protein [Planctomycetota bacterium]